MIFILSGFRFEPARDWTAPEPEIANCRWQMAKRIRSLAGGASDRAGRIKIKITIMIKIRRGPWRVRRCTRSVSIGYTLTFFSCYCDKNSLTDCHDHLVAWFALAGLTRRFGISPGRDPRGNFVCRHSLGRIAGAVPGTTAQACANGRGSEKSDAGLGPGTVYRVRAHFGSC